MIVLEMKCPQLSKPEETAARNENSIGDRMEKKPWEKPGSVGGPDSRGESNLMLHHGVDAIKMSISKPLD